VADQNLRYLSDAIDGSDQNAGNEEDLA